MNSDLVFYSSLLNEIKDRIRQAQIKAVVSANAEMILLYWDIGRMIHQRQQMEGWGTGIIPRLARDIRNELPEVKGFSERNISYMVRFFREYGAPPILQQAVAKLPGSCHRGRLSIFQFTNMKLPKMPSGTSFNFSIYKHEIAKKAAICSAPNIYRSTPYYRTVL